MAEKQDRQKLIAEIIRDEKIHTQEELVSRLGEKGISITQATLSRDLRELGTIKFAASEGEPYYKTTAMASKAPTSHININSIEISGQMCVLKMQAGFASAVAALIDETSIPGIMATLAGADTVLVILRQNADSQLVSDSIKSIFNISEITVRVAGADDIKYAEDVCEEIFISSQERKTGIARRTPEYIREKMLAGKAVIAFSDKGEFAGFSYIESWGGKTFVANSGLIVAHKFRGQGLANRIKEQIFQLSRSLFPDAKIFSITTGAAVMKMNYRLGFRPVPFSELTDDPEFWKGCEACRHFDILKSHDYKMCICTGLLYDPAEH